MDVREKLAEIERAAEWFEKRTKNTPMPVARKMFELAGESLREKAHGATIPEWISVKDRLPEQFVDVLVFRNGNIKIDHREENGWFAYDFNGKRATNWMPLPQPPKGE